MKMQTTFCYSDPRYSDGTEHVVRPEDDVSSPNTRGTLAVELNSILAIP